MPLGHQVAGKYPGHSGLDPESGKRTDSGACFRWFDLQDGASRNTLPGRGCPENPENRFLSLFMKIRFLSLFILVGMFFPPAGGAARLPNVTAVYGVPAAKRAEVVKKLAGVKAVFVPPDGETKPSW